MTDGSPQAATPAPPVKLSVFRCFAHAWRSFAKWWIPLCLISGFIFVFNILPRLLVADDMGQWLEIIKGWFETVFTQNVGQIEQASAEVRDQSLQLLSNIVRFTLYFIPAVAILTVILLMYANWAAKNKKERRKPVHSIVYITVVNVLVATSIAVSLIFLVVPGIYLYIKLLFVALVMLEAKKGGIEAIRISWRMTSGNFWPLFALMALGALLQAALTITIIGVIPATGFVNTARAAAFRTLWEGGGYGEPQRGEAGPGLS